MESKLSHTQNRNSETPDEGFQTPHKFGLKSIFKDPSLKMSGPSIRNSTQVAGKAFETSGDNREPPSQNSSVLNSYRTHRAKDKRDNLLNRASEISSTGED